MNHKYIGSERPNHPYLFINIRRLKLTGALSSSPKALFLFHRHTSNCSSVHSESIRYDFLWPLSHYGYHGNQDHLILFRSTITNSNLDSLDEKQNHELPLPYSTYQSKIQLDESTTIPGEWFIVIRQIYKTERVKDTSVINPKSPTALLRTQAREGVSI